MKNIKLYETQKKFISDCKTVIQNSNVGIFSSPTGTGKTISLLCSIAEYIKSDDCDSLINNIFETNTQITHIYFTSKTHSQLNQCINEFKRLSINTNSVVIGSRKMYCINKLVNNKDNIDKVNQMCKYLQDNEKCEYVKNDMFINGIVCIEEVVKEGKRFTACPYEFIRKYYKSCELVFLPYNILFSEETRKAYKLNLQGSIVIVDEAHNILDTVEDINTKSVNFYDLQEYMNAFQRYTKLLKSNSKTKTIVCQLMEIFSKIAGFRKVLASPEDVLIFGVNDFLRQTGLLNVNMLDVEESARTQNILLKIDSYMKNSLNKMFDIVKFLTLLVNSDEYTRVKLTKRSIKLFPLDTKMYFEEFMACKSIIFAGGTMEPVNRLKDTFATRKVSYYSYESVCNKYRGYIIDRTRLGHFELKDKTKNLESTRRDIKFIISNILKGINTKGIVVFLPSTAYLTYVADIIKNKIQANDDACSNNYFEGYRVLYENKNTFSDYSDCIETEKTVLFAVIGGKLSEGINFSDDLCRVLVILGVPFSNMTPELQQKIHLLGQEHYLQNAMNKVNQTIGRAIRHKDDYSTIFLVDCRYVKHKSWITPWIQNKLIVSSLDDAIKSASEFLTQCMTDS